MKHLLVLLLLSASLSFGQSLQAGGVLIAFLTPVGGNQMSKDFALIGGFPQNQPQGQGGNFSYSNASRGGPLDLTYHGVSCEQGCAFHGNFASWGPGRKMDIFCSEQIGTLTGTYSFTDGRGILHSSTQYAEYSQQFCSRGPVYWLSGGTLTVHP